jgi:hypothetical protein
VAYCDSGRRLVTCGADGAVAVWRIATEAFDAVLGAAPAELFGCVEDAGEERMWRRPLRGVLAAEEE